MVESVNKIKAYRDGQQREFTQKVWDAMGIGHCGWTAVPEVPKEVVEAVWVDKGGSLTGSEHALMLQRAKPKEVGVYAPPGSQKTEGVLDFKPRKPRQKK